MAGIGKIAGGIAKGGGIGKALGGKGGGLGKLLGGKGGGLGNF